jgi:hypothetical protein
MELLSKFTDKIDLYQVESADFEKTAKICENLARSSFECLEGLQKQRAGLYLAEIAIFRAKKDKEKLAGVEKLLNEEVFKDCKNTDFLRCRGRLLTEQKNYKKAAALWAEICNIRKSQILSENQRSWQWWRAKYFELFCCCNISQSQRENALHTIEVLENSFNNIPQLWADKLMQLKSEHIEGAR